MSGCNKIHTFTKKEFTVRREMPIFVHPVEQGDRNPTMHICSSSGLHHAREKKRPCLRKIITPDIMFEYIT